MTRSPVDPVRVLIVDDDPDIGAVYEAYLDDGFEVATVTSGEEALARIHDGDDVDVVLLDRRMPEQTGDEVLTELRRLGHDVPVAMVTAVDPDADILDLPVDEYLTKPVDRRLLRRTVRVLANRTAFEEKSREFFRLAAKKASLDSTETGVGVRATEELRTHLSELQAELDRTASVLRVDEPIVAARNEPDRFEVEALLAAVFDHALPADFRELVEEYQSLEAARPPFMWKWVHRLAPRNTLPCVDEAYVEDVPVDKATTILFITLLDDGLEKLEDRATFSELAKIPSASTNPDFDADGVDAEYVSFAIRVWDVLLDRLQRAPHYEEYLDLFRYDVAQAVNAIEYSELVSRHPELGCTADLERYESHNMVMFAYADIDLMHSSLDVRSEHPVLREAIWTAQLMARIGNWVSTWERELREGDFSAGPIVWALENGIVTASELRAAAGNDADADALVERLTAAGVEKEFLIRWEQHYHELTRYADALSTIDLDPFVDGMEDVLRYHLASTGLK